MSINLRMPETTELKPRITVFGVGGAGGNAVNNMIESNLQGVEFVAANADAQALHNSRAERAIQIGTANYYDPTVSMRILDALPDALAEINAESVEDIVGTLAVD